MLVAAKDARRAPAGKKYNRTDPQLRLRMLTENITARSSLAGIRSTTCSAWPAEPAPASCATSATAGPTTTPSTTDDAYRALDTTERLLAAVGARRCRRRGARSGSTCGAVTAEAETGGSLRDSCGHPESAGPQAVA